MSLSEHYLRLMNLANQAQDPETYHYFVQKAQQLLNEETSSLQQALSVVSVEPQRTQQEAA